MFDPSDTTGATVKLIPPGQADAARQVGGEDAYKMIDPASGTAKWIRRSQLQAAADAGGLPANMAESKRIQAALPKDKSSDIGNHLRAMRGEPNASGQTMGPISDTDIGAMRGLATTYTGVLDIARRAVKALGYDEGKKGQFDQAVEDFARENDENFDQKKGDFFEGAAEFLTGDEALKGLSAAERMKVAMPALKAMEKSPWLARVVESAMKNATLSGGQAYAKTGGDAGAAATSAAVGGALGGGLTALGEGVSGAAGKIAGARAAADAARAAETSEAVRAEAEQAEQARLAESARGEAGWQAQAHQIGGRLAVERAARDAAKASAERLNATRAMVPEMAATPEGAQAEPTGRMVPRTLAPVDTQAIVSKAVDFGAAADSLQEAVKPSYDRLNEATGGEFQKWRAQRSQALANMKAPGAPEKLAEAEEAIDGLYKATQGKVSPEDFQAVTSTWRDAKVLDGLHQVVEPTYAVSKDLAAARGVPRSFDGNAAAKRLKSFVDAQGRENVERVVGKANLANMEDIFDLNRSNASRAKFGEAVGNVARQVVKDEPPPRPEDPNPKFPEWMKIDKSKLHYASVAGAGAALGHMAGIGGFEGAGAAVALDAGAKYVMRRIFADPKLGQQIAFAVRSGARPEFYAPFIAQMLRDDPKSRDQGPGE